MPAGAKVQEALALMEAMETLLNEAAVQCDRREEARLAFFRKVMVETQSGEHIQGFCRDLSILGVGLLHTQPVPVEQVRLIVPIEGKDPLALSVDLKWCSAVEQDLFTSGGRLLRVL